MPYYVRQIDRESGVLYFSGYPSDLEVLIRAFEGIDIFLIQSYSRVDRATQHFHEIAAHFCAFDLLINVSDERLSTTVLYRLDDLAYEISKPPLDTLATLLVYAI
jgi:hypothetical protein